MKLHLMLLFLILVWVFILDLIFHNDLVVRGCLGLWGLVLVVILRKNLVGVFKNELLYRVVVGFDL